MFNDKLALIELIIFLTATAAWLVQAIYRAYMKPVSRDEQENRSRPESARGPQKDIRDFLAEIRGDLRGGSTLKRPAAPARPAAQQPPTAVDKRGPGQLTRDLDRRQRAAREGSEEPTPPRETAPPVTPPVAPGSAPGSVHAYFEDLAQQERATAEKQAGQRARAKQKLTAAAAASAQARGAKTLVISGLSVTLRDAVLAQMILGPPRCRDRSYRRK